ncbi:unnamed protein product [Nippostrongylus brasiliensis]|uniref:Nose resistant to fluoxetine protein 5 (inferred by orthology to a C. elegans protein) n=1 Tax=Nippostrongylus brasiliensis TaxID=27835 RepID=A0A0N4YD37_NIPBR|nr:unnamed protein product [Nippostrongylus brasiliensis]
MGRVALADAGGERSYNKGLSELTMFKNLRVVSMARNRVHAKNAGIYFRINQKAVDYITELASDAMPQILNNMHLPDVTVSSATISKIHINRVEKPTIQAKFLRDRGVRGNVTVPFLRTSADCTVDSFFPLDGSFVVELHDFVIDLELNIRRNETSGRNIIEIPHCAATHSNVSILLQEDSLLVMIQGMLQSAISDAVKTTICETILEAVKFVDLQELQQPVPRNSTDTTTIQPSNEDGFDPAEFGASLCEMDRLADAPTTPTTAVEPSETPSGSWGVNLDLVYPPKFSDDDVVFGVDGGVVYNGQAAENVQHPPALDVKVLNTKMIGIMLSDSVPNTFFAHVFNNKLGTIRDRFDTEHFPKALKKIANAVCSKCFLEITANLTEQPRVEVNADHGARVELAGYVLIQFQGRDDLHNLINASTKLHVTLKPTIRHSRVYGDVALTNVDVKVFKLGVGGILRKPLEKLVSFVVPKVLWPMVKRRIRFAINKRGVQLPVMCGVEFDRLSLFYVNRAAVINTDFTFDLPLFVRKFKLYLMKKSMVSRGVPTYVEI